MTKFKMFSFFILVALLMGISIYPLFNDVHVEASSNDEPVEYHRAFIILKTLYLTRDLPNSVRLVLIQEALGVH